MAAAVAFVAGCYHPVSETACSISCDVTQQGADCPTGLACIAGICRGLIDTCAGSGAADAPASDVAKETDGPPADGCQTFGTGVFTYMACPPPAITDIAMLPSSFNTQTSCAGGYYHIVTDRTGTVCVVNASTIIVPNGGMRVIGGYPLVLAANTIQMRGNIDVGSSNISAGAGAGYGCGLTAPAGTGGNGGAGGTASGQGGTGGAGSLAGSGPVAPTPDPSYTALRGGCPGSNGDNGPLGGASGGIVYLIATGAIDVQVSSTIYAGGARGAGGGPGGGVGGGAGGAGGAIVLDGGSLVHTSTTLTLCALGGGGGGGGPVSTITGFGSFGQDGCTSDISGAAGGGQAASGGGNGGDGNFATRDGSPGNGVTVNGAGGGGGGGAAGFIVGFGGTNATVLGTNTMSKPAPQ